MASVMHSPARVPGGQGESSPEYADMAGTTYQQNCACRYFDLTLSCKSANDPGHFLLTGESYHRTDSGTAGGKCDDLPGTKAAPPIDDANATAMIQMKWVP